MIHTIPTFRSDLKMMIQHVSVINEMKQGKKINKNWKTKGKGRERTTNTWSIKPNDFFEATNRSNISIHLYFECVLTLKIFPLKFEFECEINTINQSIHLHQ